MKKNAFGKEHIKNGRCGEDIARNVTTREGPAGPRRHPGLLAPAPEGVESERSGGEPRGPA